MSQFEQDVIAFANSQRVLTEAVYRAVDSIIRQQLKNKVLLPMEALTQLKNEIVSGIRRWRDWERDFPFPLDQYNTWEVARRSKPYFFA